MSELIDRIAKAMLRTRYSKDDLDQHWPDGLDGILFGPPFEAEGWRDMARAAIEAMREPSAEMLTFSSFKSADDLYRYQAMIDAALAADKTEKAA